MKTKTRVLLRPIFFNIGATVTLFALLSGCGQGIDLSGYSTEGRVNPQSPTDGAAPRTGTDDLNPENPFEPVPPGVEEPVIPTVPVDPVNPVPTPVATPVVLPTVPPGSFFLDVDYESEQRATQADVVWTIDNSTSMAEEAQNVRVNFDSFVRRLEAVSDVKMGLISSSLYNPSAKIFGVKMADDLIAKGHAQLDAIATGVGSWNLFAFAAISSCASNRSDVLTDAFDTVICGRRASNPEARKLEEEAFVDYARGKLVNFYRPGAKRVYIFVTDDESRHFKGSDFKAVMDAQVPNNYHVFGFVGNSADTRCKADATGSDYIALAATTGGKTFPICDADWTPHFNTLESSIFKLIEKGYEIPVNATVQHVYVDDVEMSASKYILAADGRLYFKKGVVTRAGQKIRITVSLRADGLFF